MLKTKVDSTTILGERHSKLFFHNVEIRIDFNTLLSVVKMAFDSKNSYNTALFRSFFNNWAAFMVLNKFLNPKKFSRARFIFQDLSEIFLEIQMCIKTLSV